MVVIMVGNEGDLPDASEKREEGHKCFCSAGKAQDIIDLQNHRCSPLQNGLDLAELARPEPSPVQLTNGDISDPALQTSSIDQTNAMGKRGFSRPGPMINGLGAPQPRAGGLNYNPKTSMAKNKSTTNTLRDQYTLSSETYDLDFPPSNCSGPTEGSSIPGSGKTSEKIVEISQEKETICANGPQDLILPSDPSPTPTGAPCPPSDHDCSTSTPTPSINSTTTSPSITETSSVAPATKIANGPRKKGNKAKWVPIQITRAPFRDEFFSATQGAGSSPSNGGPPKPGFSRREGNGPPNSSTRRAQAQAHQAGPTNNNVSSPNAGGAPFRRQNSQVGVSQGRDCPTPSNNNKNSGPEHANNDQHDETSTATTSKQAVNPGTVASCGSITTPGATSQSLPLSPPQTDLNKIKSGDDLINPSNLNTSSPPVRSPSSSSKPTQNGPSKVGIGGSSTLPRRPGPYPNQRSSGGSGSSRVSQTIVDGPGSGPAAPPAFGNHHISHNMPLFAAGHHPGLSRLHLNGHPLPAYISPTAHQHPAMSALGSGGGPFQIPLMAPYPYDNEAYYNYNTVLAHPFFTHHPHHHPPHMYYRSIAATPGLPILPQHSPNIAGLLPLAPLPGPNPNQQRWNGDNNNNPTPDPGSLAPKASSSQHIRSNSVAGPGYTPQSQNVPTPEQQISAPAPSINANQNTVEVPLITQDSPIDISVSGPVLPTLNSGSTTTAALSSTPLAPKPQQQTVTNVRSKSETSATPPIGKDLVPQPQAIIAPNLPSLMTALGPPKPLVGPTPHFYAQNSLTPAAGVPLIGPPLAPAVVPPAILVGPEPSPIIVLAGAGHPVSPQFNVPLVDQLRKQIEYYFSEENLLKDLFLRRNMDPQGFIPLSLIATFHRVKMLTADIYLIRQAIKLSTEVDFVNDRVRTKHNPAIWPINIAPQTLPNPALATAPYAQIPAQHLGTPSVQQSLANERHSQFTFPSCKWTAPSPLSDDDVKLLGTLLKRDPTAHSPPKFADSISPRYFNRYLTFKSYSLPDLSNPHRASGRARLIRSCFDRKINLSDCYVVTPTEQLTRVLRPDPNNPYFQRWKECKSASLLKVAQRLAQILTSTFVHLNTTQLPFDRLSAPTTSTRGDRSVGRKRCYSFPSPQSTYETSSFLPKISVCTEPGALVWCYENQAGLAHDTSPKQRKIDPAIVSGRYSQAGDGTRTGSDLIELLKHEGWITLVPYNTLLRNLESSDDASGLETTLKSLYAFWSQLMTGETSVPIDQNLLDSFRETVYKYRDPHSTFRFGIDRLLETYSSIMENPSFQHDNFLSQIISDLSRMIQNGGMSVEEAKLWVYQTLFPPLNSSTRARLMREISFLQSGHP